MISKYKPAFISAATRWCIHSIKNINYFFTQQFKVFRYNFIYIIYSYAYQTIAKIFFYS